MYLRVARMAIRRSQRFLDPAKRYAPHLRDLDAAEAIPFAVFAGSGLEEAPGDRLRFRSGQGLQSLLHVFRFHSRSLAHEVRGSRDLSGSMGFSAS
ncbi:MAG: hypothetical protein JWP91_4244 [Fibrobacteres bacterium]|nr:hypothetical protein [Fibrobacterota bacterium]